MTSKAPDRDGLRQEARLVAMAATLLSILALGYCYSHQLLLLYGDSVAHLHIARRVFDSLNPGFRQLGSVWLPLPHILLIPFVQNMEWWQSGLAGSLPSMLCYVLSCVGIYRLARLWLGVQPATVAVAFYALNPGLLYLQTTAMTEPLFLAEMIWSALLLAEACRALEENDQRRAARNLAGAGLVMVAAVYTRYDGWIYASFGWLVIAAKLMRRNRWREPIAGAFVLFTAMLLAAPIMWMAYNARQFGDPLDFLRGPYSAKAIELRTATPGSPHYPGYHSMPVAALHFIKAAELGAAPLRLSNLLLWLTIAGSVFAVTKFHGRAISAALLLWMPLPFYSYSIAYGSVPIFIPIWWPHSWYNTRYGMEMLPAFALYLGFLFAWVTALLERRMVSWVRWALPVTLALIVADAAALTVARPLVLQEALANSKTRIPFESALADALRALPAQGSILMYTSAHVGALQQAGIPLVRTINEGDYYQYAGSLRAPAKSTAFVVGLDGDDVAKAVEAHPEGLELLNVVCSTGQPCAHIYRSLEVGK